MRDQFALMLYQLSDSVFAWSEVHQLPNGHEYPWNSFVVRNHPGHDLAVIDPLEAPEEVCGGIESLGEVRLILLTCEYHLRDSCRLRERWGARLLVNRQELDRYNMQIGGVFSEGDVARGNIDAISLTASFFPETAFLIKDNCRVMIIGDLICGGRSDAGIPPEELGIAFPEYLSDLALTRESLRPLLDLEFDMMCFGHGWPVRNEPKEKLRRFVDSDDVWEELERVKGFRCQGDTDEIAEGRE